MVKYLCAITHVALCGLILGGAIQVAAEDEITGCLKLKRNGKLKRFAEGDTPTKDCKSNEALTSLPTTEKTDALQAQIDALIPSSVIGGAHEGEVSTTSELTRWMGMFITHLGETRREVLQRLSARGIITKLSVVALLGPGGANTATYSLMTAGGADAGGSRLVAPLALVDSADLECTMTGDETMCSVEGCVEVEMGTELSVQITLESTDGSEAFLSPAPWNARFIEDGTCDGGFVPPTGQ